MKRGAEKQLTKDGHGDDDDDIEEIQDPQGFQKADEFVLAKRQIRALPKRALAASRPPSLNGLQQTPTPDVEKVEAIPPPKFGSFAGFGAGSAAPNPFTFTSQPPPPSVAPTSDTAFKPAQSTSAFNSSIVSPLSGMPLPSPPDADAAPSKPTTSSADEPDAVAFKYFKSLRGLNVSFLSALSSAVEKDPFFDIANLVESYKNLRTTIQLEFDSSSQLPTKRTSVTNGSTPLFGAKELELFREVVAVPQSLQKPLGASAEAPSRTFLPTASGLKTSGFTFPPFIPPSSSALAPVSLTSNPSETSSSGTPAEPAKSTFTFAASKTPVSMLNAQATSGLSFTPPNIENKSVSPPGQGTEGPRTTPPPQPTPTAPSFGSSTVSSFLAHTKPTNTFGTDATSKPTSVFGASIFGSGGATEFNKPSLFAVPPSDSRDTSKANTTLFGNVTTSTSTSTNIFSSSSDKPTSLFGSASPPKTTAFVFGKPAGSIGNPVGFGFGGSLPSVSDNTTPGPSGSGFTFGAPSPKPNESLFSPPPTDKSVESTPQPDVDVNEEGREEDTTKPPPSHTHDEEGEGEEDEETTHVVKCKVYRLSKSEDKSEWKDLGIGMFRLKKHKETNVRRALMRNTNTGRILVNFRMHDSLKLSLAKTSISFIGYEDSTPTSFRIRVKTEEQAEELKQAMEREIAALGARE